MTLIQKSDVAMSVPGDAPVRVPQLPVAGAVARWVVSSLSDGALVKTWESIIPGGPTLAYTPGIVTGPSIGTVNGIRAAHFDGISDGLSGLLAMPQPHTLVMVIKTKVLDNALLQVLSGDQAVPGGADDSAAVYVFGNVGTRSIRINAGSGPGTKITPTDQWGVLVAVFNGAESVIRLNSAEQVVSAGIKPREGITFGHYKTGSNFAPMDLAEAAVFPHAMDATARGVLVAGLRKSYDI